MISYIHAYFDCCLEKYLFTSAVMIVSSQECNKVVGIECIDAMEVIIHSNM